MRRFFLVLITALFVMGADSCDPSPDPPPSPTDPRFCAGVGTGVIESTVRGVTGDLKSIIGGYEATDYLSTVQVMIQDQPGGGWGWCSGTVISPHTVLTAGHCMAEQGPQGYRVFQDRYKEPDNYRVPSGHLRHPGYSRWDNNICMIDLDTGAPCTGSNADGCYAMRCPPHDDLLLLYFTDALPWKPVTGIYDPRLMWQSCSDLVAQGWGATTRAGVEPPPGYEYVDCSGDVDYCLQEAPLEIIHDRYSDYDLWVRGWGNKCFGDSGGPTYAVMEDGTVLLVGVTSTVSATNCVGTTTRAHGTDVKAAYYKKWIESNTAP